MIKRIRDIEQYLDRKHPKVIGVAAAEDQDIMELVKEMEKRRSNLREKLDKTGKKISLKNRTETSF